LLLFLRYRSPFTGHRSRFMKFLALVVVLVLEQLWPLRRDNPLVLAYGRYARFLESQFDGGEFRHGLIAWVLAVAPPVAVVVAVHQLLHDVNVFAGLAWSVAVLYFTMGFRQFSHAYSEIQQALKSDDLAGARERLGRWRGESAAELPAGEVARVAIEQGLLASHRHVFGSIAWFLVLGPAGAVLYRAGAMLAAEWLARTGPQAGEFARFAGLAFHWIDWLPARLTAASFAIVGDFEDAAYCWRTQAASWQPHAEGIILAAGGGALGVRLGETLHQPDGLQYRPALGAGEEADADTMTSAVGLAWRSLVLWMFVVLLVTVAYALG
jgi:adenosylcobinamide-phosphate synthase